MIYEYKATAINVVDGDTLDVLVILRDETVDLGFRLAVHDYNTFEQRVRLYGIDTPERGQAGALDARTALFLLVTNTPLLIETVKPRDKYGRWLARIATPTCPDVAQAMIDAGHGVAYDGGARQSLATDESSGTLSSEPLRKTRNHP